jgi:4-hydroxybenzoate polyprenyltransferase
MIRKIVDLLLGTYLFIASASACLVLTTYLLTGEELRITGLTALVFFSTILIYNFHKVSSLFTLFPFSPATFFKQFNKVSASTKLFLILASIGVLVSSLFVHVRALLVLLPLAIITIAYSLPVISYRGSRKRLREIFIVKITTLSLIWCISTVTLPLIDKGITIFTLPSLFIFVERFLFMFAICIPFEIRDMEQEKKWGVITLPQRIGVKQCKILGLFALLIFMSLVYIQFGNSNGELMNVILPMFLTAIVTGCLVWYADQRRSKYYFRIFVDGTMQLQFILLILFKYLG